MTPRQPDHFSIVADVGGTNTRVALAEGAALLKESVRKFPNREFSGLDDVLRAFLAAEPVDCAGAAVAIAGPVRNNKGTLTNLDWSADPDMLSKITGAETVAVLNDLQAQGHAMGYIPAQNLTTLKKGRAQPDATRLVIGVGTGFNAAVVLNNAGKRIVPPSESGHASMPVHTPDDLRLCAFVEANHGFAAVEDVLSGRGLERIYSWHQSEAGNSASRDAAKIMSTQDSDENARKTVQTFLKVLGAVAGDLALVHLPFGGISLVGGVARAMKPHFETAGFCQAFLDKGRFENFMQDFSIELVEDDYAALDGLARLLSSATQKQSGLPATK